MTDACERCGLKPRTSGNRYCPVCRKAVLKELRDAGALTPRPRPARGRGDDARENQRETRLGLDF